MAGPPADPQQTLTGPSLVNLPCPPRPTGHPHSSEMPFVPPVEHAKCPKCGRSVYAAEEMLAAGAKWHKVCFVCGLCRKRLDSTNVGEHAGELYCKQCYGRKFGPKGYGFGAGAGCLTMDKGEHLGNTECAMSNRPHDPIYG
ncbi:muscle LIM protein 1-like [Dermacentor albipictus]|uniref:muscle LIM protein 1-like n=1 Tax=Dermacentor albipictus TaxID=60249 RepID=UPI0031FCC591